MTGVCGFQTQLFDVANFLRNKMTQTLGTDFLRKPRRLHKRVGLSLKWPEQEVEGVGGRGGGESWGGEGYQTCGSTTPQTGGAV